MHTSTPKSIQTAAAVVAGYFASPVLAQPYAVTWWTASGSSASIAGGAYTVGCTSGLSDAGPTMSGGTFTVTGGFWAGAATPCYANCDGSQQAPVLNVGDFTCFLQKYAAGDSYANCDGSTSPPVLNVGDFTCYLQRYAAGCP